MVLDLLLMMATVQLHCVFQSEKKKKPIGLFCESFSYLLQKQCGKPQIECEVKKKTKMRKTWEANNNE